MQKHIKNYPICDYRMPDWIYEDRENLSKEDAKIRFSKFLSERDVRCNILREFIDSDHDVSSLGFYSDLDRFILRLKKDELYSIGTASLLQGPTERRFLVANAKQFAFDAGVAMGEYFCSNFEICQWDLYWTNRRNDVDRGLPQISASGEKSIGVLRKSMVVLGRYVNSDRIEDLWVRRLEADILYLQGYGY